MLVIFCAVATMNPQFRRPAARPYRAAMYAGLGISAIVFIARSLLLHGWEVQKQRMSLDWMLWMGCLNLVGATAYATRLSFILFTSIGC